MDNLDCGYAVRALNRFLSECGDTGRIYRTDTACTLALIDVLGHGAQARLVAQQAEAYLDAHYADGLTGLLQGLHAELLGTRGAVGAVCRLYLQEGLLECAGIGNITVKVIRDKSETLISRDGIIGYHTIRPHVVQTPFAPGDIVLMFSDGIKSTVNYAAQKELLSKSASEIAGTILREYGTKTDDASCIVMKYLQETGKAQP